MPTQTASATNVSTDSYGPPRAKNYLNQETTVRSWLLTTDHKRIGLLYLFTILLFFTIAAFAAAAMRIELATPKGDFVLSQTYNKLFTIHGVLMVWFFLIPSIPTVLGNFLIPLMIGARDLAFPKLNLASWYIFITAGAFALYAVFAGGVETGWTFYTPLSTKYSNTHVFTLAMAVFISGFSSILTGLNFIITIHKMRAPGMTWMRLPLFCWSTYATSLIMVLATPVLAVVTMLLAIERVWGVGIFDPALGGDPVLFQHLFWFYSHPAVYIMILPGFGVVSELITCFSRKRIFGYEYIAFASMAIAILGFVVWGHHMFLSSQSVYSGMVFSFLSFMIAVPSAIKVFNWTATLYKGSISFETPMLYALGFIGLFTIGGMTGLFVAALATDVHLHDTYFVVAHFHYIMVGGMVLAFMGGLHFWWPKITGRRYPEALGQLSALVIFIGFNLTFFPQFILGYLGMPRRYHAYPPEWQVWNVLSSAGATILAVGYLMPFFYLIWSLKKGPRAAANPWQAAGLEWQTSSPPPTHNFEETPIVTEEPYAYPLAASVEHHEGNNLPTRSNMPDAALSTSAPPAPLPAREMQFEDLDQQTEAAHLGMWLFLSTEILFFGGLFGAYTVYRVSYPAAFAAASKDLLMWAGAADTAILLISSFAMALAVYAAKIGARRGLTVLLLTAAAFGALFLCLHGFEYYKDFIEHHVPGRGFRYEGGEAPANQVQLFFLIYFVMTGLHSLHVTIGVVILTVLAVQAWRGKYSPEYHNPVEVGGLYWHFVDIVWVFLFPLLYLVARH